MSNEVVDVQNLATKVAKLERGNRRVKYAGILVLLMIISVAIMGQATPLRRIETRELILRDGSGRVRAGLATLPDGSVGLTLIDQQGAMRAILSVFSNGTPTLVFLDKEKRTRISMSATEDAVLVNLADGSGRERVRLAVQSRGYAVVSLRDSSNHDRLSMNLLEDGQPNVFLLNQAGQMRAQVSLLQIGPVINLTNGRKTSQLMLALDDGTGAPLIRLSDAQGRKVFEAP